MWNEIDEQIKLPLSELMKIIDDALCHGFEFKVENRTIYYREIEA